MSKLRAYQSAVTTNSCVDITEHLTLVRKLASMMISRLPASVELDDLVQVGMIGLIEAAQQFGPAQGVLFETFASQRIRGAMLDELRRLDWLPRQARRNAKQIEEAMAQLEQSLGHPPGEGEIAARLGLSVDEYQTMLFECKGHQLVYFEDFGHDDDEGSSTRMVEQVADQGMVNPFEILGESRFRSHLVAAIKEVLRAAIAAGGSSIRDFHHIDGSEGHFKVQLRVYGRTGLPCPECGAEIRRIIQGGRSSFFCPKCQRG